MWGAKFGSIAASLKQLLVFFNCFTDRYFIAPSGDICTVPARTLLVSILTSNKTWRTRNAARSSNHCPGVLLISILASNKTWRTRNAARSANGDCGKITQYFAMISASHFFVCYMRSSMGS